MARKKNALGQGKVTEGVVCLVDTDAYSTIVARCQYLKRHGIPDHRATLFAGLIYGEMSA